MQSRFQYKIKRHIPLCSYERLWIVLTIIMVVSVFVMIRGSKAELIIDTQITRLLFCSDVNGDKTLYDIAIGYFSAYLFYILQVYIPERKKTIRALNATALDAYNFVNQTMMFLFVWDELTDKTSDGAIMNMQDKCFFFKDKFDNWTHDGNVDEMKNIAVRAQETYLRIIKNPYFDMIDENIHVIYKDTDIAQEIKRLLVTAMSANVASETGATIYETYDPDDVERIKTKMMLLKHLYGFNDVGEFEVTTDSEAIKQWEDNRKIMGMVISENIDFFANLPEEYSEVNK